MYCDGQVFYGSDVRRKSGIMLNEIIISKQVSLGKKGALNIVTMQNDSIFIFKSKNCSNHLALKKPLDYIALRVEKSELVIRVGKFYCQML